MPPSMGTWAPVVARNASPAMTDTRRPTSAMASKACTWFFRTRSRSIFCTPRTMYGHALPRGVLQHGVRFAPSGADHRVENDGPDPLIIIETQLGLCPEDDIVRLEDDFGRA